jgi:hypothetical protein
MDPKPVNMTIGCGICYKYKEYKKHMYIITEVVTQENPRIHSGYTQGYMGLNCSPDSRYSSTE